MKKSGIVNSLSLQDDGSICCTATVDGEEIPFKTTDKIYKSSAKPYWKMPVDVTFEESSFDVISIEPITKSDVTKKQSPDSQKRFDAIESFKASKANNAVGTYEIPGSSLKSFMLYVGVALIAVVYWTSKGTPNPALFFAGSAAKEECLRLAGENKGSIFLIGSGDLEANNTWIKDGKRVVQLVQESPGGMRQIMCLYGNGMVSIPSALEQGRWQ